MPTFVLSPAARHEYYLELGNSLPAPAVPCDKYDELRVNTAIEAFEALRPGDAYEGLLAVQIVLAGAHAIEAMREAGLYRDDFAKLCRCRAQAAGMMRAGASAKRALEREQRMRWGMEAMARAAPAQPGVTAAVPPLADASATPPAPVQAGSPAVGASPAQSAQAGSRPVQASPARSAQVGSPPVQALPAQSAQVGSLPVQAGSRPVQASPARSAQAAAAAPLLPPAVTQLRLVAPLAAVPLAQAGSASPLSAKAIERAETFVADNLEAAVRIRHDRGVTAQAKALFRRVRMPTDPAVIDALVRGTSPLLSLLDGLEDLELDAAD